MSAAGLVRPEPRPTFRRNCEPFEIALLYSLTLEASEPEYETRRHATVGPLPEPGFWLRALYRVPVPASLSPIATVPASMRLPEFDEVAVKAADVVKTATPAISASTATVMKILRLRPCESVELLIPPAPSQYGYLSQWSCWKFERRRRGNNDAAIHLSAPPSPI